MKNFESQPSSEEFSLEYFDEFFKEKQHITLEDLSEMKKSGISTENFLAYLRQKYGYLFHGSRADMPTDSTIHSQSRDVIYASSDPVIAILKSIYLNNAENLGYPMTIDGSRDNLALEIKGPKPDTVGEKGYVYVISDTKSFEQDPESSWQYVQRDPDKTGVPYLKKVEIERDDFKYPVTINRCLR